MILIANIRHMAMYSDAVKNSFYKWKHRKRSMRQWVYCTMCSALREWVLDSREVKSEEKMSFTLFEKCKWKKNDLRSRSRNESEMKMTENRDREVKVKWKSFEIEIEKWNFSRIFENLLDQREGGGGRCLRLGWNGGGWGQRSWRNGAWGILWRWSTVVRRGRTIDSWFL